jgi:hypothetical protein
MGNNGCNKSAVTADTEKLKPRYLILSDRDREKESPLVNLKNTKKTKKKGKNE